MSEHKDYRQKMKQLKCCVLIPTYNNEQTLAQVITDVRQFTDQIVLVNDGSTDNTENILEQFTDCTIVSYKENQGKGFALRTGFKKALDLGYEYAITLDSDAQHKAIDLPTFLEKLEEEPAAIIIGARNMNQENVPGKSSFGNKFSNFWFKVNTGVEAPDTQSGYRLYPIALMKDLTFYTKKYEFEVEVLVRASWKGIKILAVPIDVFYPVAEERVTHFRPFQDFSRISVLNTVLVATALLYIKPRDLFRKIKKKSFKQFWNEYILSSEESNSKIASSVALGAFLGVSPFWGYQMALVVFFSVIFKLNKVIALVVSNISFGPMTPIIIYISYLLGSWILFQQPPELNYSQGINLELIKTLGTTYLIGAFSFSLLLAIFLGGLSYLLLLIFRKNQQPETA